MTIKDRTEKAIERYNNGEKYSISTSIDEDTILAGYGNLDYDFEFPLPPSIIEKEFGTTSWGTYFENKGMYRWISTHNETKQQSILARYTEAEIEEIKKLPGNENFTIERI